MITTTKAASQDVYDLIDDDYFIMDVEQDLFVVFECLDDTQEVTIEDDCLIVRIPHCEIVDAEDVTDLISCYYLNALEKLDKSLHSLVYEYLRRVA